MEFFNYQIQLKENPKKESLNVKTYKEILKYLKNILMKYMRKTSETTVSSLTLKNKEYILLTKQFKEKFEQEMEGLPKHLIRFVESYRGKFNRKVYNHRLYQSEDVKLECVKEWVNRMFSDYQERIKQVYQDYLQEEDGKSEANNYKLQHKTLEDCAGELAIKFFPLEDFLFLSEEKSKRREVGEEKADFLLENGQQIVGSNFDIDNWSDVITRGVSSINQETEDNPWVLWLVVGVLFILFILMMIIFYFTFSYGF